VTWLNDIVNVVLSVMGEADDVKPTATIRAMQRPFYTGGLGGAVHLTDRVLRGQRFAIGRLGAYSVYKLPRSAAPSPSALLPVKLSARRHSIIAADPHRLISLFPII
jgi:hypothetical protein